MVVTLDVDGGDAAFPIFRSPKAFEIVITRMVDHITKTCKQVDVIVGLDARGFLLGPVIASRLQCAFVPIRKVGKVSLALLWKGRKPFFLLYEVCLLMLVRYSTPIVAAASRQVRAAVLRQGIWQRHH